MIVRIAKSQTAHDPENKLDHTILAKLQAFGVITAKLLVRERRSKLHVKAMQKLNLVSCRKVAIFFQNVHTSYSSST